MEMVSTSRGLRFAAGRIRAQVALTVEGFRLQLVTNLLQRQLGDRAILRPHVDGVSALVAERFRQLDRRSEQFDCLGSSNVHAPMLNPFSGPAQAHLATPSLKWLA